MAPGALSNTPSRYLGARWSWRVVSRCSVGRSFTSLLNSISSRPSRASWFCPAAPSAAVANVRTRNDRKVGMAIIGLLPRSVEIQGQNGCQTWDEFSVDDEVGPVESGGLVMTDAKRRVCAISVGARVMVESRDRGA